MKIAIRDDDVCFYTNQEEFEKAYGNLGVPISVSVIPNAYPYHGDTQPYGQNLPKECRPIEQNHNLVSYLKNSIGDSKCEILLHGYDHMYVVKNGKMIPEMIWKEESRLEREIPSGKKQLELIFNVEIKTFVAPSNEINAKGIRVIEKLGMNFSGCFHGFTRKFDSYFITNFFKRYFSRLKYGVPLGGTMVFKHHKELNTVGISDLDRMKQIFFACKKNNWNLVIVSHYWQLRDNDETKKTLYDFVSFLRQQNDVEFSFVSECF